MANTNILLEDSNGNDTFKVNAQTGFVTVGGNDEGGIIVINDKAKKHRLAFNGNEGSLSVRNAKAKDLFKVNNFGTVEVGGTDTPGSLFILDGNKKIRVFITSLGSLKLLAGDDKSTISLDAVDGSVRVGSKDHDGLISVRNQQGIETVSIRGADGDIVLKGADCAEEFEVEGDVEPGSVLVLNDEGHLEQCRKSYDTKVAGVVSGAGPFKPGIILGGNSKNPGRVPVALVGRVMCLADASREAIRTGDLLTTAKASGHAMKVSNKRRAFGAVLGKALAPLPNGRGLIPILVALQ